LGKFGQGKVLGHKSDNGLSSNPMIWVICYEDDTEILFFKPDKFEKLWYQQLKNKDK
jgi:hypothetical protein